MRSIPQAQSNNTRAQKWLAIAHYRIGACTLAGAKHLTAPQLLTLFTHHARRTRSNERRRPII